MKEPMTDAERERQKKISDALRPFSRGEDMDGNKLDFGRIAVNAHCITREFAEEIARGEEAARQKLHTRRYKG